MFWPLSAERKSRAPSLPGPCEHLLSSADNPAHPKIRIIVRKIDCRYMKNARHTIPYVYKYGTGSFFEVFRSGYVSEMNWVNIQNRGKPNGQKKNISRAGWFLGGPMFVPVPRKSFIGHMVEFYLRRKYFHGPESGSDSAFSQMHVSRSRTH